MSTKTGEHQTWTYDALGRMRSEASNEAPGVFRFDYDLAGRRKEVRWWDGAHAAYDWLPTGELWRVRENGAGSGVGVLATYGYDDLGRRVSLSRGNGVTTTWSYRDPAAGNVDTPWLMALTHDLAGTAQDVTRSFTRSAAGEIRTVASTNDAYAYQPRSNVSRGYGTADATNRYPSAGPATLQHDGRGNLTKSIDPERTVERRLRALDRLCPLTCVQNQTCSGHESGQKSLPDRFSH